MNNQIRRQLLERHRASGFPGSIMDVFSAYNQGIDLIADFQQQQQQQVRQQQLQQLQQAQQAQQQEQQVAVAETPEEQAEGLRPYHEAGNTNQTMVFPNVPANTPFNTVGMKAPINIEKYNNQGHLIESFKNVPPGIQSLPTGSQEGIVIETPANMQRGGVKPAPRMGTRKNADGTESTHLYATETLDGKNWIAFPTLFQNPDSSWIDMSGSEWYPAYQEALKRGEVIDFGKRKNKALKWGEGSWKNSMQTGGKKPNTTVTRDSPNQIADYMSQRFGGDPRTYLALSDTVAFHESAHTMDPKITQMEGGPGVGAFQIEPKSYSTFINRAERYFDSQKMPRPAWLNTTHPSQLNMDQQRALFLINMTEDPNTNMRAYGAGKASTYSQWMAGWKKKASETPGQDRRSFNESRELAKRQGIPGASSKMYVAPNPMDNYPFLRNPITYFNR